MVSDKHLDSLYSETAQSYQRKPNDAERGAWSDVLVSFSRGDIDASIRRWRNNTKIEEFTHRPKGARMPSPAELKASIEEFDRQEKNKSSFTPCNQNGCRDGWVRVFHGQTFGWREGEKLNRSPVNGKTGAVHRCQCWLDYLAAATSKKTA